MKLANCNLCPLANLRLPFMTPCEPLITKADIMIVSYQPTEDEISLDIKAGTEYDLLQRVIKAPFYFTHLIKCLGKVNKGIIDTCMKSWLNKEIDSVQPKLVVTMGKDVSYHLINEVKRKDSIREIAGRKYTQSGRVFTPIYSSASILNGGRSTMTAFERIFDGS